MIGVRMLRSFDKPVGQLLKPPSAHKGRCFGPAWRLAIERRQRRCSIHGGDRSIEAEHLSFRGKPACGKDVLQSAVATQQVSSALWTDAASAGQLVGRIAAKCDEI